MLCLYLQRASKKTRNCRLESLTFVVGKLLEKLLIRYINAFGKSGVDWQNEYKNEAFNSMWL